MGLINIYIFISAYNPIKMLFQALLLSLTSLNMISTTKGDIALEIPFSH